MPVKGYWEAESTGEGCNEADRPRGGSILEVIEGEDANKLKVEYGVLGLEACELGLIASLLLR
jgi:hypothetical protein